MSKRNKKYGVCLTLRLPSQIATALKKRARAQNRSINGQIVHEVTAFGLLEAIKEPVGEANA